MDVEETPIKGVLKIRLRQIDDRRGFFVETFRQDVFDEAVGSVTTFVQDNCSYSRLQHTVRGLHGQRAPKAQGKLVTCTQGKIRDIVVDIRPNSETFGRSVTIELTAEALTQLWVPEGFLHRFITLEPDTEVRYKCTNYYAPECAIHVDWKDPDLRLDWGVEAAQAILSDKDENAQSFKDFNLTCAKSA